MIVLPEYTRPPFSATVASAWLEAGSFSGFVLGVNLRVGDQIVGEFAQPLPADRWPGAAPETSIASVLASLPSLLRSRPKTGVPQISRFSSLVCSGPLIASFEANWISTHPRPSRAVR